MKNGNNDEAKAKCKVAWAEFCADLAAAKADLEAGHFDWFDYEIKCKAAWNKYQDTKADL
jgi:hypothetical protein